MIQLMNYNKPCENYIINCVTKRGRQSVGDKAWATKHVYTRPDELIYPIGFYTELYQRESPYYI